MNVSSTHLLVPVRCTVRVVRKGTLLDSPARIHDTSMGIPLKSRRVFGLLLVVVIAVVATVSVTRSDDTKNDAKFSSDQSKPATPQVRALATNDALVVVDLRIVQGATDDSARDRCTTSASDSVAEWIIGGRNLNATTTATTNGSSESAFTYLCMQQVRSAVLQTGAGASSIPSVVRSVHVVGAGTCPLPLRRLFSPRGQVSLCVESIDTPTALATGLYVSDITATVEGTYVSSAPGWATRPIAITLEKDPSITTTVYLAIKRPDWPISKMQAVSGAGFDNDPLACSVCLGSSWDRAGQAHLKNASNIDEHIILCVERSQQPSVKVLIDVEVIASASLCREGFNQSNELTADRKLCGKYGDASTVVSYIGQLSLDFLQSSTVASLQDNGLVAQTVQTLDDIKQVAVVYRGLVVSTWPSPVPATNATAIVLPQLQARIVDSGLSFKVVQLADLHLTGNSSFPCRNPPAEVVARGEQCTESYTTAFMNSVLDEEKPDFVVFSGDNIEVFDDRNLIPAISAMVQPAEDRKIPYAVVFGNHDDENGHSRESIANAIIGRQYSYMQRGPSTVSGLGNYDVSLQAPASGPWGSANASVFRMYFLDSHSYPDTTRYPNVNSGYDWIKPDQVNYYQERSQANRASETTTSTTAPLPAIMFFHIPIPEYASVGSRSFRSGEKQEAVMSPEINTNLFSALVEMDEVKATFVGHDHTNDYCYKRQGIQLCYGGGMGFGQAYGDANFARRARVIEWSVDKANKRRIKSWKRHFGSTFATRQSEEVLFEEL